MDIIGRSPVPVPVLILGKLAFLACSVFFLVRPLGLVSMHYESLLTRTAGVLLYLGGLIMIIVSLIQLGQSVAVGIPERDTELKTHGLYRFTRNPIYLGGFFMCAGSCLHSIHLLNVLLAAIAVAVHLRIVRREEEFLEKRFGDHWKRYAGRVPRYIGRIQRAGVEGRQ